MKAVSINISSKRFGFERSRRGGNQGEVSEMVLGLVYLQADGGDQTERVPGDQGGDPGMG